MRLLYLPFVPVFIRTLQLLGSTVPTDHPDRPNTIQSTRPSRTRPKDPARARHARGRTRRPALLVVLRWRRGEGGLPGVWCQSALSLRALRWRTGGLQVRGVAVTPGTLASSPQVRTRTRPAKKRATQVHREPYDASSARGGWCLRSPLGAAVHRERRCIWLGAWRVAQVAAKLLDHRRSGALDLRPPKPTGALPSEHTLLSFWPHMTACSSIPHDEAHKLRLFTW